MRSMRAAHAMAACAFLTAMVVPAGAFAHPGQQHGPLSGHLSGPGTWGELELVSKLKLTDEAGQVADVAVDPQGEYAYLAHWGEEDCAENAETGGVNDPDAGAWVVDIRDPAAPKQVTFIAHSQDSRPGEGMQVVPISTKFFNGNMLAMNNEQCGKNGRGGVSLYDVSTPAKPTKLSEHFGDRGQADTNDTHSAFAWDAGANAYVVMTDNFESTDVDILDITNPKRPRLVSEMDVNALTRGLGDRITQSEIGLGDSSLHDMIVKNVPRSSVGLAGTGTVWVLLLSYWDGGYVLFNVDDPAKPVYIDDTDYANFDPQMLEEGKSVFPEGNGHQAEFTADNRYFIGTDEDFSPYGAQFQISTGANAGTYPAGHFGWTKTIPPGTEVTGQTVFGGFGCPDDRASIPSAAVTGKDVIVFERGPVEHPTEGSSACFFSEKVESAQLAGYKLVLIANHHSGSDGGFEGDAQFCGGQGHEFTNTIPAVCIGHRAMHLLFNKAASYDYGVAGSEPAIGDIGESMKVSTTFDGWGYVHLFDSVTRQTVGTYAIPEAHKESYAQGYGDLTVHEVATDAVDSDRAYLSYYAGGIRVLDVGAGGLQEVGGYLGPNGSNFWGVETYRRDGHTYVLGSDRDFGLFVFRNHKGGH
jgi:hypothetical protein